MRPSGKSSNGHVEILIAQDSSSQAEQLKQVLEERGHAVTVAANGKQAFEAARTRKPALIVSDIVMPEMDGYALCKSIKSEKELKDVPVILMTTLSSPEDVVRGLECGADIFIRKPYDKAAFLSRIDYALSNRTLRERAKLDVSLPIQLGGKTHYITSGPQQILDLLISTYEDAIRINGELSEKQAELTRLAEGLERKVEERTAALRAEIAERKMAEEQLRESEEQFRLIAENIADLIAVLDLEGKRLYNSPSYKEILGDPAALRGSVSFDEIHPEDRERIRKIFQETVKTGRGQRTEYRFLLRDGSVRYIESQGSVIRDEEGKTARVIVVSRDVTERRRGEEALSFKTALLEAQSETTIDGILVVDLTGQVLLANRQFARMLSVPEEAIGTKDDKKLIEHALTQLKDPDAFLERMNYLHTHETEKTRDEIEFKDGRVFDRYSSPMQGSTGKLHGRIWYFRDITERKRAEEALRQEQALMATLMENVPDAVYFKDAASRFIRVNHAMSRKFGLSDPAQLVGKSDADFFSGEHAQQALADEQEIIHTGRPLLNVEEKETWIDGTVSWVLTTKLPLRDAAGRVIGTCGISLDISDRKRVEQALAERTEEVSQRNQELAGANATLQQQIAVRERIEKVLEGERNLLRTLIDSLPDYVYAKDAEGRFTVANVGVARQAGCSSSNEVIGKSDFDLFPHELAAKYRAEEQEILRSGQGLHSYEGPTVDASKKEKNRWVSTTKMPLRNDLGEITGFVGLGHDITERKRVEQALQERNDELARFAYTVSHDLKSPLVTIRAFLGYLEQDTASQDTEAIKKDRQYIHTAVDKMTRLLEELLDLARIGHKMNPPEEVPLQVVVKDALDMVAGGIIQRGVEVVVTKEPIILCGDRTRLVEVFQNLVDNATKFMGDQQTPRVEIGVETAGDERVFFVRDNGIGIDPRYQPKLFGLFEKFDPGTKGTGIGLALVKRIVEVRGGKIWVESAGVGKGTTFHFTLAKTQPHPAQP